MYMKKLAGRVLWLFMALMVITAFFQVTPAAAAGTTKHWTGKDGTVTVTRPSNLPPFAISFNGHSSYPSSKLFYLEIHRSIFSWYSPVPPEAMSPSNQDKDRWQIVENRTNEYGDDSNAYFVNKNFSWNLKKGRQEPKLGKPGVYQGDNTGTTQIGVAYNKGGTTYNYVGKNYEWRYLGYSAEGNSVHNPYFPADYPPPADSDYSDRNWIVDPSTNDATKSHEMAKASHYDSNESQKIAWFKKYFFTNNPNFRRTGKTLDEDAKYWSEIFNLQNNPDWSTGIVVGFHQYGKKIYYINLEFSSPKMANLRLTSYKVFDNETGELVASFTRNATDNKNLTSKFTKHKKAVKAGSEYRIEASVKNMTETGLVGKSTMFTPLGLNTYYSYDNKVAIPNVFDMQANSAMAQKGAARSDSDKIGYGHAAKYDKMVSDGGEASSWIVKVPETAGEFMKFRATIPLAHYIIGDNFDTSDDEVEFIMPVQTDDIGVSVNVDLLQGGKKVDDVVAGETYKLRFYINKAFGEKEVGSNNPLNPFASLDLSLTDGVRTLNLEQIATKTVLKKQGDIAIVEMDYTPTQPYMKVTWQIANKHRVLKQSTDYTNDGPYSKEWRGLLNISAYDLEVSPNAIRMPVDGNTSASESVQLSFKSQLETNSTKSYNVLYTVKLGNSVIGQFNATLPPNQKVQLSFSVPSRTYTQGTHTFSVEANPAPRNPVEYVPGLTNPYNDNIAEGYLKVTKNDAIKRCDMRHTLNEWTTKYTIYDWKGEAYEFQNSRIVGYEAATCYEYEYDSKSGTYIPSPYDCERPVYEYYPDMGIKTTYTNTFLDIRDHFESYNLSKILIRSKETVGGWKDVKNGTAKVQAGYGFEMKVFAEYRSNLLSNRPESWSYSTSFTLSNGVSHSYVYDLRTVNPDHGLQASPSQMFMEHPFSKVAGGKATVILGVSESTGGLDNNTKTFYMPLVKTAGVNVHEMLIDKNVKTGTYQMRFDTPEWYGSTQKPATSLMLCDYATVTIEVTADNVDDMNTHITH
ncbi:Athe_2463 domain-containing protein [Psychrobacillus sp. FSL K6-1464]|uniref:Athe_2463 domain-containing protein n=1 Tax=Psychrobacillus sp. FSL K6-1464 TaxID=2921545 RepID=UPI0030F74D90